MEGFCILVPDTAMENAIIPESVVRGCAKEEDGAKVGCARKRWSMNGAKGSKETCHCIGDNCNGAVGTPPSNAIAVGLISVICSKLLF